MKAEVFRFPDAGAWIAAFERCFVSCVEEAAAAGRPAFHAALSGGRTPAPLYRALAASPGLKAAAARLSLHFWVVDERDVPPGDTMRNGHLIEETLAETRSWQRPPEFHLWPEGEREGACAAYAVMIKAELGPAPVFDLVILGMGADGHAAGLFTIDQALSAARALTLATEAPSEPKRRMTMGLNLLARSKVLVVALAGTEKAGMLDAILGGSIVPVSLVAGEGSRFYYLET